MSNISALILCCSTMLTTSYHVQVKVPIWHLLMVVERVLNVDGSLPHTMYLTLTAMQQEYICTQLPISIYIVWKFYAILSRKHAVNCYHMLHNISKDVNYQNLE